LGRRFFGDQFGDHFGDHFGDRFGDHFHWSSGHTGTIVRNLSRAADTLPGYGRFLVTDLVTTSFCVSALSCSTLQFRIFLQLLINKGVFSEMQYNAVPCKNRPNQFRKLLIDSRSGPCRAGGRAGQSRSSAISAIGNRSSPFLKRAASLLRRRARSKSVSASWWCRSIPSLR